MLLNRLLIALLLSSLTLPAYAQIPKHIFNSISGEEFDPQKFTIINRPLEERLGIYGFGESEAEFKMALFRYNDSIILETTNAVLAKNASTGIEEWQWKTKTYTVRLEGNTFYFGKYRGVFADMTYGKNNASRKVVLINGYPTWGDVYGKDTVEIGGYISNLVSSSSASDNWEYARLSDSTFSDDYFAGLSKQELKIMRNGIMARHGMIFQPGGEMDKYFRKQEWYHPLYKDVSNLLTPIEIQNIDKMKHWETIVP